MRFFAPTLVASPMTACPPDEYLSAVLGGTAPTAELSTFDDHLAHCPACQARLDARTGSPSLAAWLAGDRPPEFPFLDPPDRPGCVGRLGRFAVEREVGRGGMGVVFRAWDDALRRPVALKVLRVGREDAGGAARFAREAHAAARVVHDHLVPVLSVERAADGRAVLVLPFIDGPTLKERVRADPDFPPREAAEFLRQVAGGLAAAHAAGLVHRDVKPANILLDASDGRAKLTDFGLARGLEAGDTLTREGTLAGTPEYLAPEQAVDAHAAGPPADVYALGVTLYECLTGVVPFRGSPLDVIDRHRTEDPVPPRRLNARVPLDLETVCLRCLEKDPARRYPTAAGVEAELARFLSGRPVLARPLGPAGRGRRWVRRNPLPVAVVAVSLVGAVAAGAGWWRAGVKAGEAAASAAAATERAAEAEQARAEARAKATLADERAAVALGAITTLVGKAQTLADAAPGTLKLKKELGEAALADLRKLAAGTTAVPGADRTTVQAHLKLADAFNLLGQTDDAVREWDRGREIAERLAAADPTDHLSRRDAAAAHAALGFTRNRLRDRPAAAAHYRAAAATLESVLRERPDDRAAAHNLAVVLNGRADVARDGGDGVAARADTERAAGLFDNFVAHDPDNAQYRSSAYYTRSRLGYTALYSFHDAPAAVAHFRAGLRTTTDQLARAPADPVWRRNHRVALLDLSSGLQRVGDYPAAEAAAQEALPLLEAAATAEPDNGLVQRDLGVGLCHLSWVRLGQERFADAEPLLVRATGLFERVAERTRSPALVANDIPANWYLLALLSLRGERFAEAADRLDRWGQEVVRLTRLSGGNPLTAAAGLARMKATTAAVRRVPAALADPAPVADPQAAGLRAVVLAWRGDLLAARRETAALRAKHPADVGVLQAAAAVYGRSARAATDPAERDGFVAAGLDALAAIPPADRGVLDALHLNPDYELIRRHPAFAARVRPPATPVK